jgi:polysaccharide export outer membrane protein
VSKRKGRAPVIAPTRRHLVAALLLVVGAALPVAAQAPGAHEPTLPTSPTSPPSPARASAATPPPVPIGVTPPADYVVGPEDVLTIVFWRERDMSADVVVRPDGRISLPLLNDVDVAGLTPDQVRERVTEGAKRFVEEPNATVVVKQINSRKVYITGSVERPGPFPLLRPTTILQLISLAGGLKEFAKAGDISVVRTEGTQQTFFQFNYDDVKNRKNLTQNILLKPGDTVIVP